MRHVLRFEARGFGALPYRLFAGLCVLGLRTDYGRAPAGDHLAHPMRAHRVHGDRRRSLGKQSEGPHGVRRDSLLSWLVVPSGCRLAFTSRCQAHAPVGGDHAFPPEIDRASRDRTRVQHREDPEKKYASTPALVMIDHPRKRTIASTEPRAGPSAPPRSAWRARRGRSGARRRGRARPARRAARPSSPRTQTHRCERRAGGGGCRCLTRRARTRSRRCAPIARRRTSHRGTGTAPAR